MFVNVLKKMHYRKKGSLEKIIKLYYFSLYMLRDSPFYAEGLMFSCTRCSACCRYSSGYVFLSKNDTIKLTAELNMDFSGFTVTYCRWVARQDRFCLSLKEKSNFDCIFWDNGCKVYNSRPLQCRTFPFWENVVTSSQAWEMASSGCPGINTGAFHSREEISKLLELQGKQQMMEKQSRGGI